MNSTHTTATPARVLTRAPAAGTLSRRLVLVLAFALATALAAQVRFYMPDNPYVPHTLQTVVVMLAGVTLGGGLGAAAMGFYLLLGVCGYQVFADPATANALGLMSLAGPTAGYLVGFVLAQPVLGALTANPSARSWSDLLLALLAGYAIVFACGVAWLAVLSGFDWALAVTRGLLPFLFPMLAKLAIGLPLTRLAVRRGRWV